MMRFPLLPTQAEMRWWRPPSSPSAVLEERREWRVERDVRKKKREPREGLGFGASPRALPTLFLPPRLSGLSGLWGRGARAVCVRVCDPSLPKPRDPDARLDGDMG